MAVSCACVCVWVGGWVGGKHNFIEGDPHGSDGPRRRVWRFQKAGQQAVLLACLAPVWRTVGGLVWVLERWGSGVCVCVCVCACVCVCVWLVVGWGGLPGDTPGTTTSTLSFNGE